MVKIATKEKLDKFGPFGCAIGATIEGIILMLYYLEFFQSSIPTGWEPMIFAYLFSTCTHRKFFIYSPGALGGAIGAFIGRIATWGILLLLLYVVWPYSGEHPIVQLIVVLNYPYPFPMLFIFTPLFAFLFSRYMCKKARKKTINKISLDKFAPWGSAIGTAIGANITFFLLIRHPATFFFGFFLTSLLAYIHTHYMY